MTNAMMTKTCAGLTRVIRLLISIFFPAEYFNSLAFPPSIYTAEEIGTTPNYYLINTYKNSIPDSKLIAHVMGFIFFIPPGLSPSPVRCTGARHRDVFVKKTLQNLITCL